MSIRSRLVFRPLRNIALLALRITTELKDKAPSMMLGAEDAGAVALARAPRGPEGDAVSALVHLGYSQSLAAEAVARATGDLGDAFEAAEDHAAGARL